MLRVRVLLCVSFWFVTGRFYRYHLELSLVVDKTNDCPVQMKQTCRIWVNIPCGSTYLLITNDDIAAPQRATKHKRNFSLDTSYTLHVHKMMQSMTSASSLRLNTLRPRQNGRNFPDDIFKWIFLNENVLISIKISLKFLPRGSINNIPALVQIMGCRRPSHKPLSEPMMA